MIRAKIERLLHGIMFREGAGVKLQRYIGADRDNLFEPILLFDYFDNTDGSVENFIRS